MTRRKKTGTNPHAKISRTLRKVIDIWNCFLTYITEKKLQCKFHREELCDIYTRQFMEDPRFVHYGPPYVFDELVRRLSRNNRKIKFDSSGKLIENNVPFEKKTISDYIKEREENRVKTEEKTPGSLYCILCDTFFRENEGKRGHRQGKNHKLMMTLHYFRLNREALRLDKSGVKIYSEHDSTSSENDMYVETYSVRAVDLTITIENTGETVVFLKTCEFMRRGQFEIVRRADGTTINPNGKLNVTVRCRPQFVSNYKNVIAFHFENPNNETFHIFRSICVEYKSTLQDELQPIAPYTKCKRVRRRFNQIETVNGMKLPDMSSDGLKMFNLDNYYVPGELRSKVASGDADDSLVDELEKELSITTYASKFSKLLHVEEIQMEIDIEMYRMEAATMTYDKNRRFLRLKVPGLAENRPSVLRGDHLYATPADNPSKRYQGYVHHVEMEEVVLGFDHGFVSRFVPNMKFGIDFTFNRLPLKLQHLAVGQAMPNKLFPTLFPDEKPSSTWGNLCTTPQRMKLFDRTLESNKEQHKAIKQITEGVSRPAPYLVFGPPGTGKTVTIVEAIKQVYDEIKKSRILACAPSNSAADLIATRILKNGPVAKSTMFRMNARSRGINTIDPKLMEAGCCNIKDGDNYFPDKKVIEEYRVVVTTLCTAGRLARAGFSRDHFTHIFIDEAGHAQEPEAIIPIFNLLNPDNPQGGQLVLAGDPKQLGPVLRSPYAVKYGLAKSLLERLMLSNPLYARKEEGEHYNSKVMTKLLKNYRSHPDILKLPNEIFYDNELQASANEIMRNSMHEWEGLPKKKFPLIFHGVDGKDEREGSSPSFFNTAEAVTVMTYVERLMTEKHSGKKVKQTDIGVISPYRKQVQKIQKALKKHNYNEIKVGSVEEFQGQERLVIIVSTVRSNREDYLKMDREYQLGFLDNPKRFNVAITRAKALLIVIGNPVVLSKDKNWKRLINFCKTRGGTIGVLCDVVGDDENLLDKFNKIKLTDEALEAEEAMDVSQVAQQNDPAWRAEL